MYVRGTSLQGSVQVIGGQFSMASRRLWSFVRAMKGAVVAATRLSCLGAYPPNQYGSYCIT